MGESREVPESGEVGARWSEARARIDRGEAGSKRAGSDPAISPLGTDEQAGGSRTPPQQIEGEATQPSPVGGDGPAGTARGWWLALVLAALVLLALVVATIGI